MLPRPRTEAKAAMRPPLPAFLPSIIIETASRGGARTTFVIRREDPSNENRFAFNARLGSLPDCRSGCRSSCRIDPPEFRRDPYRRSVLVVRSSRTGISEKMRYYRSNRVFAGSPELRTIEGHYGHLTTPCYTAIIQRVEFVDSQQFKVRSGTKWQCSKPAESRFRQTLSRQAAQGLNGGFQPPFFFR